MADPRETGENNHHYSEQPGHALRGEHARLFRALGGMPPETVPGFDGIEIARRRRSMRRPTKSGKARGI